MDPEWHWQAVGWCQAWNLSGKPTFWERPFKGRLSGSI